MPGWSDELKKYGWLMSITVEFAIEDGVLCKAEAIITEFC